MTDQLPILIPLPLFGLALVLPVVGRLRLPLAFPITVLAIGASAAAAIAALARVLDQGPMHYFIGGWAPPVGIEYVVDVPAAFVAVAVMSVSLLGVIATRRWALREAGDRIGPYYALVLLLLAGLIGIVVTGDLFNLFVFLEIASISAYALVFLGGRKAMVAGFRYLILGTIGGALYLLGVGFIYFETGTLNMADASALLSSSEPSRSVLAAAVFIVAGLGLKMGLVPLHTWLPDAYNFAPSSINTLIAPVMTKVAAFAILRMFLSVFPPGYLDEATLVGPLLGALAMFSVVFGSLAAVSQTDYRRMLAYSSIAQLGLIALGVSLGTPLGLAAALLHTMNHAVMKACLFMIAGAVRFRTGATALQGFAGLGRLMPMTMASFVVVGLAMVGVPPLMGFFSKFYLAQAGVQAGNWAVLIVVLLSGVLTASYMFRVVERAYLTPASAGGDGDGGLGSSGRAIERDEPREVPLDMLLPVILLAVAALVVALANGAMLTHWLEPATRAALER